jgi:uncharacterized RDD family membrane protein YckC
MVRRRASPGWRRVAAFGVDYGVIAGYLAALALIGLLLRATGVVPREVATPAGRILGQVLTFAALNVPVSLWFAVSEAAPRGATPGKRLLGLRVVSSEGGPVGRGRSLLRTALKLTLPWELAHTAVWSLLTWPGDPDAPAVAVLLGVANAVIVVDLVSLFVGSRRTPYDRVAGTIVVHRPPAAPRR